jgi:ABC-type nitrate/sulfonate/bicarbonate transport system ATPase subunit
MSIQINGISKFFGNTQVLKNFSLTINDGEIVTILGKNGCGKSTLLKLIAGIEKPDEGTIVIDDKCPHEVFPSIVFQDFRESLFPWMSAEANIQIALRNASNGHNFSHYTDKLGIEIDILSHFPYQLSGGEAQLVAIARALTFNSKTLLLDEPSSALTYEMEQKFHKVLVEYRKETNATILLISHDPREALNLSDELVILPNKTSNERKIKRITVRNQNISLEQLLAILKESEKRKS